MIEIFHQLPSADLSALAAAMRTSRLDMPFTDVAVRRFYSGRLFSEVVRTLDRLAVDGMSTRHIALVLESIVSTRFQSPVADDMVELVWTGPESTNISNRDTGVVVRELFGTATTDVVVVGFAVYQGKDVFHSLVERMARVTSLRVRLFLDIRRRYGDTTRSTDLVWQFINHFRSTDWPGEKLPEIFYDPRSLDENQEKRSSMHAKCVVVDRRLSLVTSANFTEAAQTRNIEVGTLVRSETFSRSLVNHFESLVTTGDLVSIPMTH